MNPKDKVGSKKAPLRYVPPALALGAAEAMLIGADKYGPMNWREQPVSLMTYIEAIERHIAALKDGQDEAEDTGIHHMKHIAAGAGIVLDALAGDTLLDDRFAPGPAADILRAMDKSVHPLESEPKVYKVESVSIQYPVPLSEMPGDFIGTPYEDLDGCINYRGIHVVAFQATPAMFRELDAQIADGLRPPDYR